MDMSLEEWPDPASHVLPAAALFEELDAAAYTCARAEIAEAGSCTP